MHDHLGKLGEVTLSDGHNYWWGRATTGQMIISDGVLQRIAENYAD